MAATKTEVGGGGVGFGIRDDGGVGEAAGVVSGGGVEVGEFTLSWAITLAEWKGQIGGL